MNRLLWCLLLISTTIQTNAQRAGVYQFERNLEEESGKLPPLKVLKEEGIFQQDVLPELKNVKRSVYVFDKNCGLQFDNRAANGFLKDSYTIEIYFKFAALDSWKRVIDFKNRKSDNGCYIYDGKLNFYNFALGTRAPVRANEYTHYVISRNGKTKQLKMYVDGEAKVEFTDQNDEGVIDEDGVLNFFYDDLIVKEEASAGSVAMIKLFDFVVVPTEVKRSFIKLSESVLKKQTVAPITVAPAPLPVAQTNPPVVANERSLKETSLVLSGQVQNETTRQPVKQPTILVFNKNNVEKHRLKGTDEGLFKIAGEVGQDLYFMVEADGFFPSSIHYTAKELTEKSKNGTIFTLKPVMVSESIVLNNIRFAQGKPELLPESAEDLNRLWMFMRDNPSAEIELQGHTDNLGNFDLNLELSRQRVEAVKAFLISKGIVDQRISGRGFGSTRPVANNNREETRQLNRRVEFIIKKLK
ncbi:OmpA family protein [Runella slithyformis]|uniref:OmpA/MotB domain protein n=1 Tax=Runella slithyformis (strain ATCC 29530 / DSM 19594 / LMG 11500 / NCIMB 11436 / LSU 4) TaxID=761193 RepID=A0A7U4E3Z7_RUNSL|nr:OmpA family protein [Runella slithyformis]AEI46633.1 OmpA/MotB domain protein [Runella slithyformis DSM 19594]